MRLPIAPEGLKIIKWVWFVWLLSLLTVNTVVISIFSIVLVFVISFFRDPLRDIDRDNKTIYSAADGKIMQIHDVEFDNQPYYQIITFLSVFNCHVNRIPFAGKIINKVYTKGKFLAAMRNDIDKKNERQEIEVETSIGIIRVVQITGAIARRICCDVTLEQQVSTGERFGLIRFGSRTDVYLPKNKVNLNVAKGDNVKGGITNLASIR